MSVGVRLRETADGVLLPVRVVPRASRTTLDGVIDGAVRVRLAAPPVEGAANRELLTFVAKTLGLPRRDVELVAGERSKQKTLLLRGVTPDMVLARLLEDA